MFWEVLMEYRINDQRLTAAAFISFANQIWQGDYNLEKTAAALSKTQNITAYDGDKLVGCLRILSDGYFLEPLQNFWFYRTIRNKALAANCCSLPEKTHLLCCILAHSRGWNLFMKKMAVRKACNLI